MSRFFFAFVVLAFLTAPTHARKAPPIPDFTQGGETDGSHDWNLGATGASGWIHAYKHTDAARQILVTRVAEGSPADGVLKPDDVILGINDRPFQSDARIAFGRALAKAEAGGRLPLLRWREGKTTTVALEIPVLGAYAETAPYQCPKSAKILSQGCQAIAERGLGSISIPTNLNALALLAGGEEKYRDLLAGYARRVAAYQVDRFATWHYGYAMVFLAEYVLATGDETVLPGLQRSTAPSGKACKTKTVAPGGPSVRFSATSLSRNSNRSCPPSTRPSPSPLRAASCSPTPSRWTVLSFSPGTRSTKRLS